MLHNAEDFDTSCPWEVDYFATCGSLMIEAELQQLTERLEKIAAEYGMEKSAQRQNPHQQQRAKVVTYKNTDH